MAEKSAASPNDALSRDEWRTMWGVVTGVSYAGKHADVQTQMDHLLNTAHENCAKRHQHEPWSQQQGSITLVSGTSSYAFPANFKRLMAVTEAPSTGTIRPVTTTREDFFNARQGADWTNDQRTPRWFYEYMDDSEPPVQYWRRFPTPDAAGTALILYRPFFAPLSASGGGSNAFTWLNAEYDEEIRYDFLTNYYAIVEKDTEKVSMYRALRAEATELNREAADVAMEDPFRQGVDDQFRRQLG